MHIGSVLSGLEAENVNNDERKPVLGCQHMHSGVKNGDFFEFWRSWSGLLSGHILGKVVWESVLSGFDAGNVNTDAKMSMLGLETCTR